MQKTHAFVRWYQVLVGVSVGLWFGLHFAPAVVGSWRPLAHWLWMSGVAAAGVTLLLAAIDRVNREDQQAAQHRPRRFQAKAH
ncbi:MAG: hypothetical protein JOY84_03955 [Curvibacter sp.]|nr:hypothetical protein [Curvibacter sp.]